MIIQCYGDISNEGSHFCIGESYGLSVPFAISNGDKETTLPYEALLFCFRLEIINGENGRDLFFPEMNNLSNFGQWEFTVDL